MVACLQVRVVRSGLTRLETPPYAHIQRPQPTGFACDLLSKYFSRLQLFAAVAILMGIAQVRPI